MELTRGYGRLLGHPGCRAVGTAPLPQPSPALSYVRCSPPEQSLCSVNARGVNIWREEVVGGLQWEEMQQWDAECAQGCMCARACAAPLRPWVHRWVQGVLL